MTVSSETLCSISAPERFESPIGTLELVDGAPSDITVYQCDRHPAPGHLSGLGDSQVLGGFRRGPPALRELGEEALAPA